MTPGTQGAATQWLTGWGRATRTPSVVSHEESTAAIAALVRSAARGGLPRGLLPRGLGRSYGDAALNAGGRVLSTSALTRIGEVDADGIVDVQAGVSIESLLSYAVPRGWFVPVTPGTRQVSLGGAVAADVHGKNHHRDGSLGQHLLELEVVDGTGEVRTLRPLDPGFAAVVGGMGLAGIVTRVRLRLRPIQTASLTVRTSRTSDLADTMATLAAADHEHRYTVAWLDTLASGAALGRGVVTVGDHTPAQAQTGRGRAIPLAGYGTGPSVPAPPWAPAALLSAPMMRVFNAAYHRLAPAHATVTQESVPSFFHPLDSVRGWNRLYGRRGFLQHQLAVQDAECVRAVLELFARRRVPGFLAVLKRFGPSNGLPLSFPTAGWTLAMDLPALPGLAAVLDEADELVAAHGGRLYLAKDSRMRPELLPVMYPQLDVWREQRELLDPHHVFVSDLSRRLHLC